VDPPAANHRAAMPPPFTNTKPEQERFHSHKHIHLTYTHVQLDPELWTCLLPVTVRLLGRPQPHIGSHHTPLPAALQHHHRTSSQLLRLARHMAPRMNRSQVIQAAMQLVGETNVPPVLHTFINGWVTFMHPRIYPPPPPHPHTHTHTHNTHTLMLKQ